MTTNIKITTHGMYVSEGSLTLHRDGVEPEVQPVSVGPGNMVQKDFYVPHDATVTLELSERPATDEEKTAATQAAVNKATAGGAD